MLVTIFEDFCWYICAGKHAIRITTRLNAATATAARFTLKGISLHYAVAGFMFLTVFVRECTSGWIDYTTLPLRG